MSGAWELFQEFGSPFVRQLVIGVTLAAPDVTAVPMAMGRFPRQAGEVCSCVRVCVCMHVCAQELWHRERGRATSPKPEPGGFRAIAPAVPTLPVLLQPSCPSTPLCTALPQQSPGWLSSGQRGGGVPAPSPVVLSLEKLRVPLLVGPDVVAQGHPKAEGFRSLRSCVPCWLLDVAWENYGKRGNKPRAVTLSTEGERLPGVNACRRDALCSAAAAREQREVTSCLLMTNVIRNYVKYKVR